MKELHYISEVHRLSYKDLCIHPNLNLSEGSKVTKFVTFDGNPLEHWKFIVINSWELAKMKHCWYVSSVEVLVEQLWSS